MHRRNFLFAATAGMTFGGLPASPQRASKPVLMKPGTQQGHSAELLHALAAFGVNHICSGLPSRNMDENWTVDGLTRLRRHVESFGIRLEMVPLPLGSDPVTESNYPNIILGRNPARDREIADVQSMIRNAAKAGIPALKYNFTLLGVPRSAPTRCRGGAMCSTFYYEEAPIDPKLRQMGAGSRDWMWENIEYFLERVVPVAEEAKVRIACHPNDPGMPDESFHGVPSVLSSVAGLKRFIDIHPSPYHGINLCQGTVCEMLADPNREILDVIRYFGSRRKIFNVHFRNIKGKFLRFQEVFPDDGSVDMLACARAYRDIGYDGMLMPDHAPSIEGDRTGLAFAFELGYIQAAIQMVRQEA